ncbi:WxcM-like domain-containing protein [Pseudoalteromonas sp. J010]|uniref:sugar 3,4-ketoisomerase n=1 Tax=Pseudoalteromonas sp. J010 TaxID=998465 RepID=UPI000F654484|nr:FdtA/QdtA family cupin domain-containing protein [Pseudoalteromonas sp. J010]RRS06934.1 WxcM-like domain-containing protein [Pseudoalteromonas sp. J010]
MIKQLKFTPRGDDRGSLIALEVNKDVPFDIRRIYYIYGTKPDVSRGFHAHKDLKQVLFAASGGCDLLLDDGKTQQTIRLESPEHGVLIDGVVWREMHNFTPDCVLMVLASAEYDESDYLRDYDEFINWVTK